MANLLADASTLTQSVITAGLGTSASSATYAATQIANLQTDQIADVGISTALSVVSGQDVGQALSSAATSLTGVSFSSLFGGGTGGLSGTKPVPLHTERAGSEAEGSTPYSFDNDIEFFLLRADQSTPAASVTEEEEGAEAAVEATTQTGSNWLGDAIKSPLGQLATGLAVDAALGAIQSSTGSGSLVAPLTGLAVSTGLAAVTGSGIFSQSAATATGGSTSAVSNAVQTGPDPVGVEYELDTSQYWSSSESYFSDTLSTSFDPSALSQDPFSTPVSDLAVDLGESYPAITSDASLAESINNGDVTASDWADPEALNLGIGSIAEATPILNEDATSIQNKDTIDDIPKSWYFVTAPQDVSWSKEGKVATSDTYGTNTPYVLYGSTSLRKLTLSNAMIEGFSDAKTVEANIVALETCMNMVVQKGYTAPFCWKAYAGGKSYGTFIISGVKVKEVMRDTRGYATRAFVDIELQQVPDYQVNSGRDLASKATLGGVSSEVQKLLNEQNKDDKTKKTDAASGKTGTNASSTSTAGAQDKAATAAKSGGATAASTTTPVQGQKN